MVLDEFTLVELLVVIAIIAAVMALMIPVFEIAKKWSQRGLCWANLRQCSPVVNVYVEDDDYTLPKSKERLEKVRAD
jgi:prepilin-type N-terminal cleavage/methylation domain-containing protein